MSVWMMQLPLSADEEERITEREQLPLPMGDLPDLSMIRSPTEFRHLLQALNPDAPPERLQRLQERYWRIYEGLGQEDIIAVPLPRRREVAIAEVTGPYTYTIEEDKSDWHGIPVKWHIKRIPFSRFHKNKNMLEETGHTLVEVQSADTRNTIRSRLPHKYNRFAAIKWILIIFIAWRLVVFFTQKMPASMH